MISVSNFHKYNVFLNWSFEVFEVEVDSWHVIVNLIKTSSQICGYWEYNHSILGMLQTTEANLQTKCKVWWWSTQATIKGEVQENPRDVCTDGEHDVRCGVCWTCNQACWRYTLQGTEDQWPISLMACSFLIWHTFLIALIQIPFNLSLQTFAHGMSAVESRHVERCEGVR